jgi:heptosyltransferase-1
MNAVLVVRPSSLGDVVYALAIAVDIADAAPGTAIDWIAEEAFVDVPALSPFVRRTIPVGFRRWRHTPFRAETWREAIAFRNDLRNGRYAAVLDLQEQVKGALIARIARGPRHGFDRNSIREPVATLLHDFHHQVPKTLHFVERCRALAAAALGYDVSGPPRWSLEPKTSVAAVPNGRYVVALHATSRAGKLWPEERWRALVGWFADAGLSTLLPWGSEAERARSERIAKGLGRASVPPRQPLSALAALLARSELCVGVDTGLTHLAAVLGTPTVAIFTETDPALAGASITGAHARDLGGYGLVPSLDDVQGASSHLLRATPRR